MANIVGTNDDDILRGTADENDTILGLAGNDTLEGLGPVDQLDGGPGTDTAVYRNEVGVSVNLDTGQGPALGSTLASIENLEGSPENDHFIGDDNANHIRGLGGGDPIDGRGGDDRLEGGSGRDFLEGGAGNDRLDGGLGSDLAEYFELPAAVRGSLATGTVRDGFGTTDRLVSIERLGGSTFDDRLTGSPDADELFGASGDDRIDAGAGDDVLLGNDDNDILNGGGGDDVIFGEDESEQFPGSARDTIRGGSGNDFINPGPGSDFVDGGPGTDTVIYEPARTGVEGPVSVDLETGTGDFFGSVDTLVSVENVIGFLQGDRLFGNDRANEISGRNGDDTIDGRGGADTLAGGFDNDTVDGGVDRARDVFIYNFDPETSVNDGSDVIRNLDVGEDALRLVSGLTNVGAVASLITVEDDGTDTTLRFVDGSAAITLIGVAGPDGPFDSVSDLVDNDIVFLV